MNIILFQPFSAAKWGLIGFVAFLAFLADGGATLNNPIPSSQDHNNNNARLQTLPEFLHALKQATTRVGDLPGDPWFKLYVCVTAAIVAMWFVLHWVGCRGKFVYLDNIVRNRAALAVPWQRYAWQGNIWFVFQTGLLVLRAVVIAAFVAAFLYLNWSWINAERDPAGAEIWTILLMVLVYVVLSIVTEVIQFLIRSMVLPLYFKQTMSLGTALLAVIKLVFTRPVSMLVYVVINFGIGIATFIIGCIAQAMTIFATCCVILSVSCFPVIGTVLVNMVMCQVILPLLVFQRCFQLGCLEQFGPQYDVFSVDLPPVQSPAGM